MAEVLGGPVSMSMTRDGDGHRTYKIKHIVSTDYGDGPAAALTATGLPQSGDTWSFDTDQDVWATCKQDATVSILSEKAGDPTKLWTVEQTFSSKGDEKRCKDKQYDDPLLMEQKVSGSFQKDKEEATADRFGRPIVNSAWEQIRGPHVEWDKNRLTVKIEQNVADLQLPLVASMQNTVNDAPLWGLPRRTILLTNTPWERKFYGQCYVYYSRTFEFEIRYDTHDRTLLDEGTKVLSGHWDKDSGAWVLDNIGGAAPSPQNPTHFIRFKDKNGENAKVILNGKGTPAGVVVGLNTTGSGGFFMSIQNGNTNHPLTDASWWIPIADVASALFPEDWDADTFYTYGEIVQSGVFLNSYICTRNSINEQPPAAPWVSLGAAGGQINQGDYNSGTTYNLGDYVEDPTADGAGGIRVEKYAESNFLLLGIPLSL